MLRIGLLGTLALLVVGCGGSDGDSSPSVAANPYASFGYPTRLYFGTFSGAVDGTQAGPLPVVLTAGEDGRTVAYGISQSSEGRGITFSSGPNGAPFLYSPLPANAGASQTRLRGDKVSVSITGDSDLRAMIEGTLDRPSLVPAETPEAGTYEGFVVARQGATGNLVVVGKATGRVDSDGAFQFSYENAQGLGNSSGYAGGRIGASGTVEDAGLALGGNNVLTEEVRAFGTSSDLTVAYLYEFAVTEYFFRMRRTGA